MEEEEKYYIEFILEGSAKVSASEAAAVEKKIAALINKVFRGNKSIKVVTQVSKFSELDLALSLYQNTPESEYEN